MSRNVVLHVERLDDALRIYHVGISFRTPFQSTRYDFRAFNDHNSCETTARVRSDPQLLFPGLDRTILRPDGTAAWAHFRKDACRRRDVVWGTTTKTFEEIAAFERARRRRYVLGVYDCRHFVNDMTEWCMNKPIPIWHLDELFYDEEEKAE